MKQSWLYKRAREICGDTVNEGEVDEVATAHSGVNNFQWEKKATKSL